ncbi:ferrous iron transport protein A [Desulfohalotomaculum tongense]|uniref:FeoA family protein n=1 Tax=Desulforadius tongensis TaxID=1216062 RepID=UPI00195AD03A|nr:FeoA domain-containing protein [Desulforadius tongensis]MBM7854900.1 ferrous iron transport protein A [Desulforadius tongensis]
MKPLWFLGMNRTGVVREIAGGRGVRKRLTGMGFIEGVTVRIIKNDNYGPLIVSLGEGRLVLGQGVANKIMVEEVG